MPNLQSLSMSQTEKYYSVLFRLLSKLENITYIYLAERQKLKIVETAE